MGDRSLVYRCGALVLAVTLGAFTLALAREWAIEDCLRFGVAAASAAVTTEATRLCDRATTERLMAECHVSPL